MCGFFDCTVDLVVLPMSNRHYRARLQLIFRTTTTRDTDELHPGMCRHVARHHMQHGFNPHFAIIL